MSNAIFNLLPNLKPFDYEVHYEELLLNQQWVLVNGITKKKAIYVFKAENILHIIENKSTIKTTWLIEKKNILSITTEDGETSVTAFFKDNDVLVLNKSQSDDCAIFINESSYSESLNTIEEVQQFLHKKYKNKAKDIIYDHKFYYIEKSKESGPYTVEELTKKVKSKSISAYCFVRDLNEVDYSNRLRIRDLIKEL